MSLQDWHHVEYLFPVGNAQHVHGENTEIMTEHFMLESYDEDCDATYFDNILVTRASPQRFCDGVEGYDSVCEGITVNTPISRSPVRPAGVPIKLSMDAEVPLLETPSKVRSPRVGSGFNASKAAASIPKAEPSVKISRGEIFSKTLS